MCAIDCNKYIFSTRRWELCEDHLKRTGAAHTRALSWHSDFSVLRSPWKSPPNWLNDWATQGKAGYGLGRCHWKKGRTLKLEPLRVACAYMHVRCHIFFVWGGDGYFYIAPVTIIYNPVGPLDAYSEQWSCDGLLLMCHEICCVPLHGT